MLEIIYANKDSYQSGWGFSSHKHDYYQLFCLVSGTGCFKIDNQTVHAGAGDCIFVRPGTEHEFLSEHDNEVTMFDMKFVLRGELAGYCQRIPVKVKPNGNGILRCLDDVYREALEKKPFFRDIVNSRFKQVLIYLLRENCDDEGELTPDTETLSEVSKKLADYLKNHFDSAVTLEDAADEIGYSRIYLCQAFKRDTGMTIMQYLYSIRLDKAKDKLINTDDSMKSIAYTCGFKSVPHFNRTFSTRFNQTPGRFRKDQKRRLNLPIMLDDDYEQDLKTRRYITSDKK